MRTQKYLMYFKDEYFLVERKISSKPCKSLCEHAQGACFFVAADAGNGLDRSTLGAAYTLQAAA